MIDVIFGALIIGLGLFGVLAITVAGASILRGFVLAKMWLWFLVPLGTQPLSIPNAVGICLIASMLTHSQANVKDNRDADEKNMAIAMVFVNPLIALLFGYTVKQWL